MKRMLCMLLACLGLCACAPLLENHESPMVNSASATNSAADERKPALPSAETFVFTATVRQGETLRSLARDFYDDAELYSRIYEVNREVIGDDPNRIAVGQIFVIPAVADRGPLPRAKPGGAYLVKSARQLSLLRSAVNSGHADYTAAPVRLAADFDLAAECAEPGGWTPIGTEAHPYTGILDGAGHSVTGLTISRAGVEHQGLVGCAPDATVQNLQLINCRVTGGGHTGAVAAFVGTVKNCTVSGAIVGGKETGGVAGACTVLVEGCRFSGTVEGNDIFTGGVAGNAEEVRDCRTEGSIVGKQATGGVVGGASALLTTSSATGTVTAPTVTANAGDAACVGGIVGFTSADVTDCDFSGTVSGIDNVGGILGGISDNLPPDVPYPEVRGCRADVAVYATGRAAGGIVGRGVRVIDCHAQGSISGTDYTGGVGGNVSENYNEPTDGMLISGCSFQGEVTATGSLVGGIAGRAICEVSACNFTGDVTGVSSVGGIVGHGPDLVRNCTATGNLLATGDADGNLGHFVGGIVGQVGRLVNVTDDQYRRIVQDSHFSGTVAGENCVGGISGDSRVIKGCTAEAQISGVSMVGGISGRSYFDREHLEPDYGMVDSCAFTGSVTGEFQVGGISGTGFILQDCVATVATVTGDNYVGGVAGSAANLLRCEGRGVTVRSSGDYAGGVAGLTRRAAIDCNASGTVEGQWYTGGVTGAVHLFSLEDIKGTKHTELLKSVPIPMLSGCSFSGVVKGDSFTGGVAGHAKMPVAGCRFDGTAEGDWSVGGIVGWARKSVAACTAIGNVSGEGHVGGVAGQAEQLRDCHAFEMTVTGDPDGSYCGGVVGEVYQTAEGCSFSGSVTGGLYVGEISGLSGTAPDESNLTAA